MAPRIITPRCRRRSCPRRHWPCRRASRSSLRTRSSAMSTNQSRASALDLRVHVQLAHLDGRLLEDVGQRELEPFGAALSEALGAPGLRARARLSVWMKSPGSPCTRTARTRRAAPAFGTRRPGQAAHGQVGGQLGELAVVQLQPGAAAQAAGHGQRRQPGRPGQRLQIVGLQIELSAPVGGVARVAREQAAIELGPQVQLPRQRLPAEARSANRCDSRPLRARNSTSRSVSSGAWRNSSCQRMTAPWISNSRCEVSQRSAGCSSGRGPPWSFRSIAMPATQRRSCARRRFSSLVEPQLQQPRRQGQDAAPGQHRGYLGQGQHGIGRAVMDLDRSQIQPGIEPLPIGLDRADRNLCAQRLAGVGFYLRPPLVDAGRTQ